MLVFSIIELEVQLFIVCEREKIEVLMKHYEIRHSELMYHQKRYDEVNKYFYAYGVIVFGLGTFLIDHKDIAGNGLISSGFIPRFAAYAFLAIAFYMAYMVMHSQFMIFALDRLLWSIEVDINNLAHTRVLTWETDSLKELLKPQNTIIRGIWFNPKIAEGVLHLLLLLLSFIALGVVCWFFFGPLGITRFTHFYLYSLVIAYLILLSQEVQFLLFGPKFFEDSVHSTTEPTS